MKRFFPNGWVGRKISGKTSETTRGKNVREIEGNAKNFNMKKNATS